jgi:hypothetical protein
MDNFNSAGYLNGQTYKNIIQTTRTLSVWQLQLPGAGDPLALRINRHPQLPPPTGRIPKLSAIFADAQKHPSPGRAGCSY